MSTYKYIGQAYKQGGAEQTLISFVATASDIKRWGGVPSKNERFHGGFQRALSQRYKKIIKYFNDNQISPGAVVVAFRPGVLSTSPLAYPTSWPNNLDENPNFVFMEFSADEYDNEPLDNLIKKVRSLLESRLEKTPGNESTEDELEGSEELDPENNQDDYINSKDDQDTDDELDVGSSKLKSFYDFLGNKNLIETWINAEKEKIERIKQQPNLTQEAKEYVKFSPEEKLKYTLVSLLRPAMIVDGQHRVNGADESDHEKVDFTVCAVQDADWVEQVFQFVVLNKMAKSISKDFLTELLNTSLTNKEVEEIDSRLETIGIKNADRKIHKFINHDSRSPFKGLIAEASEVIGFDRGGKLSQQGMISLAKRWRGISSNGKTNELNCYLKIINAANIGDARDKWGNYETWMSLFFAFWDELKNRYEHDQIWVKQEKYHLLYIVTLQALQDKFISVKASGRTKFQSMEDFRTQVREYFECVPSGFFLDWTETGLQSGSGWEYIKEAIEMFSEGKQLATVKKDSPLWR
jgi:hypothetical protein